MNKNFSFLLIKTILFVNLFLVGCTHISKNKISKTEDTSEFTLKTYAQLDYTNKMNGQKYSGTIDFIWNEKEQMRIEVTGPFGVAVLSALIDKNKASAANHLHKKFYETDTKSLKNIPNFNFDLGYKELSLMLIDQKFENKNWNCELDKNQKLDSCVRSIDGLQIIWGDRTYRGSKTILIKNENSDVKLSFSNPPTKVQPKAEYFILNMPNNYKRYQFQ